MSTDVKHFPDIKDPVDANALAEPKPGGGAAEPAAKPAAEPTTPQFNSEAFDARMSGLEEKISQLAGVISSAYETQKPLAPAPAPELDFFDNPRKVVDGLVEERLKPLYSQIGSMVASQLNNSRTQATKKYGDDFSKMLPQVEDLIKSLPTEAKMNPEAYSVAYRLVKAVSGDEPIITPVPGVPSNVRVLNPRERIEGGSPAPKARREVTISAEEADVAKDMGLTPEEYAQSRDHPEEMYK